ncbi:DUF2292 domain-containing protein [Ahniella affigens]|uniref:DUF2292 domain-containing protein n=1 Tax=Ahniella affigens TaxID=2021234 RepID=A0A2P1PYJ6_9GAMM|nr:DUF2292 domain-containing protein [Ahniella affigens]
MPVRTDTHRSATPLLLTTLTLEERAVIDAIRETQFGAVEVVLHQARIVQVVRTERHRFDTAQAKS